MVPILLIKFIVLTATGVHTMNQLILLPYGPKMCEELCHEQTRCSAYIFDEVQLRCRLVFNTSCLTPCNHSGELKLKLCGVTTNHSSSNGEETLTTESLLSGQPDENTSCLEKVLCPPADVTRLLEACRDGDLDEVKRLLSQRRVDVNCPGEERNTAAMEAAASGNEKVFDYLLQHGCNLSVADVGNESVLHMACYSGSKYIVKKLLDDHKIDVNQRGYSKVTPLFYAVMHDHLPVVKLLRDRGADFNALDKWNNSVLHMAFDDGDLEMAKYILSLNIIDIDCQGQLDRTPLMSAIYYGKLSVVRFLIKHYKPSLNKSDVIGWNLFHLACRSGKLDIVKYLFTLKELDGFEKRKDKYGYTPVDVAEREGHDDIVTFLKSRE